MIDKNLEGLMDREFQEVRKGFYYPQIPQPRLVDDIPNGQFDMRNLHIKVSEPFIKDFKEKGIEEADALNEVLTHELTHFMKYPGSVVNTLRLHREARKVVDEYKASDLRTAFTEAQTNIYMVNERKHPSTVAMRRLYLPDENDSFGRLMYGLYQEVWGQDLGIKLSKEEKALVGELKNINYLNKKDELSNFRKFVQTLKDYQPKESQSQQEGKQGQGESQKQGKGQDSGFDRFSDNEIREGIRQFAQECKNPEEFEQIVKEVLSESGKEGLEKQQQAHSKGIRPGTDKGILALARNFYTALAEKYSIPIRKKPLHKNGSLYPDSHTSFSVSDPLSEMDHFSTPGILPGITKKWIKKEGEVSTDYETVPNSILVVDNSPSMPNPEKGISVPVLGATAISNAYLGNDSKVAVYSFGGNDYFANLSKDKQEIHKALRKYSQDGGTTFNPRFLENILRQNEEEFDISVVSDMCISNFDGFIETVLGIPKIHRVHLIYTSDDDGAKPYVVQLRNKFDCKENVAILPLIREKNIPDIVMGELRKSVR